VGLVGILSRTLIRLPACVSRSDSRRLAPLPLSPSMLSFYRAPPALRQPMARVLRRAHLQAQHSSRARIPLLMGNLTTGLQCQLIIHRCKQDRDRRRSPG